MSSGLAAFTLAARGATSKLYGPPGARAKLARYWRSWSVRLDVAEAAAQLATNWAAPASSTATSAGSMATMARAAATAPAWSWPAATGLPAGADGPGAGRIAPPTVGAAVPLRRAPDRPVTLSTNAAATNTTAPTRRATVGRPSRPLSRSGRLTAPLP